VAAWLCVTCEVFLEVEPMSWAAAWWWLSTDGMALGVFAGFWVDFRGNLGVLRGWVGRTRRRAEEVMVPSGGGRRGRVGVALDW